MQIMRSLQQDSGRLSLLFLSCSSSRRKFVTTVHSMAVVNTNVFVSFNNSFISRDILSVLMINMRLMSTANYGSMKNKCVDLYYEKDIYISYTFFLY